MADFKGEDRGDPQFLHTPETAIAGLMSVRFAHSGMAAESLARGQPNRDRMTLTFRLNDDDGTDGSTPSGAGTHAAHVSRARCRSGEGMMDLEAGRCIRWTPRKLL